MASAQIEESATGRSPFVKMMIFFKKRADLSDEEFNTYWSEAHASVLSNTPIVKETVVRYSQYHIHADAVSKFKSLGHPLVEYDGAAEIWAKDVESLLAVFDDPEYLKTIVPDEEKFIDRTSVKLMLGYDEVKFDQSLPGRAVQILSSSGIGGFPIVQEEMPRE